MLSILNYPLAIATLLLLVCIIVVGLWMIYYLITDVVFEEGV